MKYSDGFSMEVHSCCQSIFIACIGASAIFLCPPPSPCTAPHCGAQSPLRPCTVGPKPVLAGPARMVHGPARPGKPGPGRPWFSLRRSDVCFFLPLIFFCFFVPTSKTGAFKNAIFPPSAFGAPLIIPQKNLVKCVSVLFVCFS